MAKGKIRAYVSVSLQDHSHKEGLLEINGFSSIEHVDENHFLATIEADNHDHAIQIIENEVLSTSGVVNAVPLLFASS